MSEGLMDALLLAAAFAASLLGMAWFALAKDVHWEQVHGDTPQPDGKVRLLRWLGASGLAASLGLCLAVDHASMASLVWIMTLAAAALAIAFTLTWRPSWLRWLPA
ncbi:MAG: DUF3325 domain-containing protein [Delftia acidovorans]|uniref:DUF3325 domain-containing protein n=1 Tax=Delftia TaxID=80865 RepID=UPI002827FC76|nr:DUF3325 domain-containing protein [Delftia acidovorans]